jgi:hypothetical protein
VTRSVSLLPNFAVPSVAAGQHRHTFEGYVARVFLLSVKLRWSWSYDMRGDRERFAKAFLRNIAPKQAALRKTDTN